jgi:hypothetical protein
MPGVTCASLVYEQLTEAAVFRHPREKRNFSDRESVDSSSFSIPTTTGEFVGGKKRTTTLVISKTSFCVYIDW